MNSPLTFMYDQIHEKTVGRKKNGLSFVVASKGFGGLLFLALFVLFTFSSNTLALTVSSISASDNPAKRNSTNLTVKFSDPIRLPQISGVNDHFIFDLKNIEYSSFTSNLPYGIINSAKVQSGALVIQTSVPATMNLYSLAAGVYLLSFEKSQFQVNKDKSSPVNESPVNANSSVATNPHSNRVDEHSGIITPENSAQEIPQQSQVDNSSESDYEKNLPRPEYSDLPEELVPINQLITAYRLESAQNTLKKLDKNIRTSGWGNILQGDIYRLDGKLDKALDNYKRAEESVVTEEIATILSAVVYKQKGDSTAELEQWSRVFEMLASGYETKDLPDQEKVEEIVEKAGSRPTFEGGLKFFALILLLALVFGAVFFFMKRREESRLYNVENIPPTDITESSPKIKKSEKAEIVEEVTEERVENIEDEYEEETLSTSSSWDIDESQVKKRANTKPNPKPKMKPKKKNRSKQSDENDSPELSKMERIERLFNKGHSTKEIAQKLNIGQDEVNMVLRLVKAEDG
ncbi:hypothetical protein K8I28_10445 [bacterium]|nr:hypothetical protein [bacterium]